MLRTLFIALVLTVLPIGGVAAQDRDPPAAPTEPSSTKTDDEGIVVTGERAPETEVVRAQVESITRPARIDKPLARFHQPFCPTTIGIKEEYAAFLTERLRENAGEVGTPLASTNCDPNALLIFARDSAKTIQEMRKEQPWLFNNMLDQEWGKIVAGTGATHAWQSTEVRGVDGKFFRTIEIIVFGQRKEVTVNDQYQSGRLNQPIRMDVTGAVVLIDIAHLPGKTLDQIADYATMRLLAPVEDIAANDAAAVPSILTLFTAPDTAPAGLTEFDNAYLRAFYALRPNANSLAIRDATVSKFQASAK